MKWSLIFLGIFFFLMMSSNALNINKLVPKEKFNLNLLYAMLAMVFTGLVYAFHG